MEEKKPEEEAEDYSTKEALKDEGKFFLKDAGVALLKAGQRGAHSVISLMTRHKKVQDLKEEVEEHHEDVKEAIADLEE